MNRLDILNNGINNLQAIKAVDKRILKMELTVHRQLSKLFLNIYRDLFPKIGDAIRPDNGIIIGLTIGEYKKDYEKIIADNAINAAQYGRNNVTRHMQRAGYFINFKEFDPFISQLIKDSRLQYCDITLNRINAELVNILQQGYEQGLGIDDIAGNIQEKFRQYGGYESIRIARTEVNGACNTGSFLSMQEYGVELKQWWTAEDERVRRIPRDKADHVILHGQITTLDGLFSNGAKHPHDPTLPGEEKYGCRCTIVPYFIKKGYRIPNMPYFYEKDLIKIS